KALANILARGDSRTDPFLPALERADFVRAESGSDYSLPARYCVLVAGRRSEVSNRPTNVDQPLIQALQSAGVTLVACEPQDSAVSDIAAYRALNLDLTTVDNVDSEIGRAALVFALLGDKDSYGVKQTANQLLPSLMAKQN